MAALLATTVTAILDSLEGGIDLLQHSLFIAHQVEGQLLLEGIRADIGHVRASKIIAGDLAIPERLWQGSE
jgi:hypothetical protein